MTETQDSDYQKAVKLANDSIRTALSGLPKPIIFLVEPIAKRHIATLTGKIKIPKIALYGRSGAGKSSIVNAILGDSVAEVRDEGIRVTLKPEAYRYERNDWPIDFVDSRGVGDTHDKSAIRQAIDFIVAEEVDLLLFVVPANDRAYVHEDVDFLTKLKENHKLRYNRDLTIILVINKIDCVSSQNEWNPPYNLDFACIQEKEPENLREEKERNIKLCIKSKIESYKTLTTKYVPVCAYKGKFDDRLWNTEELINTIYTSLPQEKQPGFAGATATITIKKNVAKTVTWSCALLAGMVCFVPVPGVGAATIAALQACLVSLIAKLSRDNKDQNKVATAFIEHMGAYGAGMGLSILIQELTVFLPVVGTPINVGAAATISGITYSMGTAATSHFVEGASLEEAHEIFERKKGEAEEKFKKAFSLKGDKDKANKLRELEKEMSSL